MPKIFYLILDYLFGIIFLYGIFELTEKSKWHIHIDLWVYHINNIYIGYIWIFVALLFYKASNEWQRKEKESWRKKQQEEPKN